MRLPKLRTYGRSRLKYNPLTTDKNASKSTEPGGKFILHRTLTQAPSIRTIEYLPAEFSSLMTNTQCPGTGSKFARPTDVLVSLSAHQSTQGQLPLRTRSHPHHATELHYLVFEKFFNDQHHNDQQRMPSFSACVRVLLCPFGWK